MRKESFLGGRYVPDGPSHFYISKRIEKALT